jgi:hypothetical protein
MRFTLSSVAALVAGAALAQAPQAPAPDPALPQRYEIELIVFAHRELDPTEERFDHLPNGFGDDQPAELREAPVFDETTFAPQQAPPAPADPFAPPADPFAPPADPLAAARAEAFTVRPLLPEELKLGNEYRKLRAIAAYEPLLHVGWVQPGLPEADSVPFDLKTLGVLNPRGTVRVHLSRFLHITLDLTYQAADSASAFGSTDGLDEIVIAPQYRLTATRSARSNELHYFDHPAFGVLVRVTPVPAPGASPGRPAA